MRVLVINPNSTASMTEGILSSALAAAASDVEVVAMTNHDGPAAIQGASDGIAATPGVVEACVKAATSGFDAIVIACFDDTGLAEARAASSTPVIGIGEAAFHAAMLFGGPFTVITTLPVSVPVIEANIAAYGFARSCAKVRASGLPVLSLEHDPPRARRVLEISARDAAEQDGAHALVLGCAGMAPFGAAMRAASGLPSVDGVAAAMGLARTIITAAA